LGKEITEGFQTFEEDFTSRSLLVILNLDKKFRVEVNTSNFVTEEVLSIKYKDNKWNLVACISKLLNKTECNYKICNKEMLTIIRCLEA